MIQYSYQMKDYEAEGGKHLWLCTTEQPEMRETMNTQFKKGALELCVLSQLVGGDKYGYELTERISGLMSIASGTLYPILRKLKSDDYVTTYLVESESGPARKYYRLTDKGRQYQVNVKREWEEFVNAVNQLITQWEN